MLTDVHEELFIDGAARRTPHGAHSRGHGAPCRSTEFRLEVGLPVWRYDFGGVVVEKRLLMPHGQNTVHVLYELKSAVADCAARRLNRRASPLARRSRRRAARRASDRSQRTACGYELTIAALPPLQAHGRCAHAPSTRSARRPGPSGATRSRNRAATWIRRAPGRRACSRSSWLLRRSAAIIASTEPWEVVTASKAPRRSRPSASAGCECIAAADPGARDGLAAELVLAADQFIVTPVGRTAEAARVRARGDEERSVIAGYHWFTDWGRDTMISLEGLTLLTGRTAEAKGILRTFTSCDSRRPRAEPVSRGR